MPDSQKIPILHILTRLELGGAQKNALSILRGLDKNRYRVYLATSAGILLDEAKEIPGLNLHLFNFLRCRTAPLEDLITLIQLTRYIKVNHIIIVHTHSSKAGILGRWAAKFAGAQVIIHTIHGWPFHQYLNFISRHFYIFLERLTAKITTRLIAVSEQDIKIGRENKIGKPEQYRLIRYGIDFQQFVPRGKTDVAKPNSSLRVGMVACFKRQKNPLDFVRAARQILQSHPTTEFFLVGDGVLRRQMENFIVRNRMQDRISLLGWRKDIARILPQWDVTVLTSLWEGLPLVFLESMACAKPVVAYNVGGAAEVVKDGVNGFLVEPKDLTTLTLRINRLLEDGSLRCEMAEAAKDIAAVKNFSRDFMLNEIENLYRQLLEEAKIKC